jgi:two-component system phosphate regulon sensor histidine kinase PhoR
VETTGQLKSRGPQTIRIAAPNSPQWRLVVKHRMGSLDAAVETLRRRNLAIGGAILLVLVASVVLVVVSAGRARQLARFQMDLAAAFSHELRTPLAVIQASAYNLVEGVAKHPDRVQQYAALVQDAGRRLSLIVDQVLLFAETQSRRWKLNLTRVDVRDAVDRALQAVGAIFPEHLADIRQEIPSGLPPLLADSVAVAHCIQNLISNAIKYGDSKPSKPIVISAAGDSNSGSVQIRVRDCGPGISPEDLPHIFKPFYRASSVSMNTRGVGLGLAIVKRLVESQGGSVGIETEMNGGSTFILTIPTAE